MSDVSDRLARILGRIAIRDAVNDALLATVTAANALKVDASAVTQPVSLAGTVDVSDRFARLVGGTWPFWRDSAGTRALPTWRIAAPTTAPVAGAALVTIAAGGVGVVHRCFGFYGGGEDIAAGMLQIRDGATVKTAWGIQTGLGFVSPIPIAIGTANTAMTLNTLNAGAAGIDYAGGLLVESA